VEEIRWLVARHAEALHEPADEDTVPSRTDLLDSVKGEASASNASTDVQARARASRDFRISPLVANWGGIGRATWGVDTSRLTASWDLARMARLGDSVSRLAADLEAMSRRTRASAPAG
jgi:hypothetical protein